MRTRSILHYFSAAFARSLGVLWLSAGLLLAAQDAFAHDIVIGQSVDISGPHGYIGKDYAAGAKVYFDYVNANGGVNGEKIVDIVTDNAGSAEKSAQITRDFLNKQKVEVLFGYYGEGSLDGLASVKVPLVAPLSGLDSDSMGDNVFFLRPSYAQEARNLVRHFLGVGISRFAVVYATDSFGQGALSAVENELRERRMSLTGQHPVGGDSSGLAAAVKATLAEKPQAVIMILETLPAAQFVKAYRKYDPGAYLLGLSLINHETLFEISGSEAAAGTIISEVVPHPSHLSVPVVREHAKIWKIYRDEPPSHVTLEGFIAAKLLVQALKDAGKDASPAKLSAALHEMKNKDLGGYIVDLTVLHGRGSNFVELNVVNRQGLLLN